jgi:hypothetical protein
MDTATRITTPIPHATSPDAPNASTPKSAKPAKSHSSYGLLSAPQDQSPSVHNSAPSACGLLEELAIDATPHAPSVKITPMTVNNAFQDGSCTKGDAIKTVPEELTKIMPLELALTAHKAVSTV